MSNERYIEDYKGQKLMVYGLGNKWRFLVTISGANLKSEVKPLKYTSQKTYLTKEEAIMSAKHFIDNKIY
jgi:predicted phosphohydrolase